MNWQIYPNSTSNRISTMYLLFITITIFHLCGAQDFKIVNGTDANEGTYPFMISLRKNFRHSCGGTILNENFILTAAHCVCTGNVTTEGLSIQYGLLNIKATEENSINVKEIICHEYDPSDRHIYDVAVLKLNSSIPEEYVNTTTLAGPDFDTSTNLDGMVIGWGRNFTNGFLPEALQEVDVIVYSDEICGIAHNDSLYLQHHICSGIPENGKGSCQGDSGGPLLVGDIQVGVVSWGTAGNCGISNTTHPKVLARVSSYSEWIKEVSSASHVYSNNIIFITVILLSYVYCKNFAE